ncbi:MAG: glutamate racemase [Fusobacterium sp. JB021]|nr:glutamate racemase [Fusobacterium sp. JB020]MDP0493105.1 glutamate racemase [Fusobacterium sp. JB021]MDP0507473.1 glutamate racemase [Fusobacterium sp. JB019]
MVKSCSIGVLDSGLGGVSVLKSLIKLMPNEDIIYVGDTKNIPYGGRTKEEIRKLALRIVEFLILNKCKMIVVACNTASIAALDYLKENCNIPIVGIIDAGVEIVLEGGYKEVSILCTPFTAKSGDHEKKIHKKNKKIKVNVVGCELLCPMIEKGWETIKNRDDILDEYMSHVSRNSEALLLACTHYPFIKDEISKKFSGEIIVPSDECVREVYRTLRENNLLNEKKKKGNVEFYVTGEVETFKEKAEKFLKQKNIDVYKIDLK